MKPQAPVIVQNRDGLLGVLEDPESFRPGPGAQVAIRLASGRTVLVPTDLLARQPDGSLRLDLAAADLAEFEASPGAEAEIDAEAAVVVPVVAEAAEVTKRKVESGRVAIRKSVATSDQVVREALAREDVVVERVPVNRVVDGPVGDRQEGDTLVIPVLKEVLVVEKRLMLVEEVRITRRRTEQIFSQTVTLRTESVEVDRRAPAATAGPGDEE